MRVPGKLPPEVHDGNREVAAKRLCWPDGALGECEEIEAQFPGWYSWWIVTPYPDPGFQPAYGATLAARLAHDPVLYGRTPGELAERISGEIARRATKAGSGA